MGGSMGEGKGQNSGNHQEKVGRYKLYAYKCHLQPRIMYTLSLVCIDIEANEVESYELCTETVHALSAGKSFSTDGLSVIAQLPHGSEDEMFCAVLNHILLKLEGDPIFSMLELQLNPDETLTSVFDAVKVRESSELPQPEVRKKRLYAMFPLILHVYPFFFVENCTLAVCDLQCQNKKCLPQVKCSCRFAFC